jgi:hypothetical protein
MPLSNLLNDLILKYIIKHMQSKIERYNEILNKIHDFLKRFESTNQSDLEADYFKYIEQDSEKLLDFINDGIIDINLYEMVRKIFIMLINMNKESIKEKKLINVILHDLYTTFKYVYENILFLIENEIL